MHRGATAAHLALVGLDRYGHCCVSAVLVQSAPPDPEANRAGAVVLVVIAAGALTSVALDAMAGFISKGGLAPSPWSRLWPLPLSCSILWQSHQIQLLGWADPAALVVIAAGVVFDAVASDLFSW